MTDLFTSRIERFLDEHPGAGGVYYDICNVRFCENTEHGHGGIDAFGKPYRSSIAFGMRQILLRTYKLCHRRGMRLINHAHSKINPIAHNFSDYWYPGEQYVHSLALNYEWFYCEDIPMEVYQSELNWKIKGMGIAFLPQYARTAQKVPKLNHLVEDFRNNPDGLSVP